MSSKSEKNQALMDEIALLSRFLQSARGHPHSSSRQQHNLYANSSYRKTLEIPHQNTRFTTGAIHHPYSYYPAPGFVPASSNPVNPSRDEGDLNRYKIDRRIKIEKVQPSLSPVVPPKMSSPKKYEIVKKYFLRRAKSPISSSAGYQQRSPIKYPRRQGEKRQKYIGSVTINSQRIANRVLQRSINRLRSGNPVCSFFKRFGKCSRQGVCQFLHVQHISQIGMRKAMRKFRAGLKPPCVFHARGGCSTPHCPFPHITPEEEKAERENRKLREKEKKKALKPKRYYEHLSPAPTEYISLIVPRNNTRQGIATTAVKGDVSSGNTLAEEMVSISEHDPRRERLMNKIALLKRRYGQTNARPVSDVPAPEFLPFKK